jgi:threonine/homoserine/homoserine lactone efflux protein
MAAIGEFLLTSVIVEITPGPNMTTLVAMSLAHGRRAGLAAVAGVALGLAVVGTLAAFGLAAVIHASPALYQLLRWLGIGYLLWLAWETWRAAEKPDETASLDGFFLRGLMTNLLNPKAAMFYVAVLPAFVRPGDGPILGQTLTLVAIYVLVATAVHTTLVLAAAHLHNGRDEASLTLLRRVLAVVLALVAIWFAWETQR